MRAPGWVRIHHGSSTVAARFEVRRADRSLYEKSLTATHEWDSSFLGAIAIPAAMQHCALTVRKLLSQLFEDDAFRQAVRR